MRLSWPNLWGILTKPLANPKSATMSIHKFNEPFHKLRTYVQHMLSPFTHNHNKNKVFLTIPSKAKPKIVLMELAEMVQGLDVDLRIPFEMHYIGHKFEDIADILELPLDAVKNSVYYAQKELKEKIERRYLAG
jgi:DNA-directed RNA polymerase specialized sigma24 family protein